MGSIIENEESKTAYDHVMMMGNNKFEHGGEASNNSPLNCFFSSSF